MPSKILLRDSFDDTGLRPFSTVYASPDIITHEQVNDPTAFFSSDASYNSDPNIPLELKNDNFIYARIKNIGNEVSGKVYVNLYANHLSLYLDPRKWEKNRIPTVSGSSFSEISPVAPGKIAATTDYFLFNSKNYNGNCCFVCTAGSDKDPDYTWIDTREKYFKWVSENPWVATRNMVTSRKYKIKHFEDHLNISNHYPDEAAVIFEVAAYNVPNGTTYGIKCDTLAINKSVKYDVNDPSTKKFLDNAYLPPDYDNYVSFYGELPNESSEWPVNAYITVAARVAFTPTASFMKESFINEMTVHKYDTSMFAAKSIVSQTASPTASFSSGIILGVSMGECGHIYK